MQDNVNTIAGWTLFAGIVGLGLSIASGIYFQADKPHRPHTMGFPIEGVVEEGAAEAGPDLGTLLAAADPAKGEAVFAKCTACHTIAQGGANGIGSFNVLANTAFRIAFSNEQFYLSGMEVTANVPDEAATLVLLTAGMCLLFAIKLRVG